MHKIILSLLEDLELIYPVFHGVHHCIAATKYGSDETGWESRLGLHIYNYYGTDRETFFLEEKDLEHPDKLIKALKELVKRI